MNNDFNVYLPIDTIKTIDTDSDNSSDASKHKIIIAGFASTPAFDFVGESILPIGIDDSYFKESGWIDYEHDKDNIIGIPTERTFTDPQRGLFVEAELFSDNPYVEEILQLNRQLEQVGSSRKLGFSIEGKVAERDKDNPKIITEVKITGVAVTKTPANPEATWDYVQKSNAQISKGAITSGYGLSPDTQSDGGAIRAESLAGSITNLAQALEIKKELNKMPKLIEDTIRLLDERPDISTGAKVLAMQVFTGMSADEAEQHFK